MPFTVITLLRTFSCCLALPLPPIDRQQEIRGMTGKNVVKQQLKAANVDAKKRSKETNWFPTEEMETGRKKEGNANKMTFNTGAKPKKNLLPQDQL